MKRIEVVAIALSKINALDFIQIEKNLKELERQRFERIIGSVLSWARSIPEVEALCKSSLSFDAIPIGSKMRFIVRHSKEGNLSFTIASSFAGSVFEDVSSQLFEYPWLLKSLYEFLFQEAQGVTDEDLKVQTSKRPYGRFVKTFADGTSVVFSLTEKEKHPRYVEIFYPKTPHHPTRVDLFFEGKKLVRYEGGVLFLPDEVIITLKEHGYTVPE